MILNQFKESVLHVRSEFRSDKNLQREFGISALGLAISFSIIVLANQVASSVAVRAMAIIFSCLAWCLMQTVSIRYKKRKLNKSSHDTNS